MERQEDSVRMMVVMPHYDDRLTLRAALDQHLQRAGFSKETYGPSIPVRIGRLGLRLPNPEFRQRTLVLHDLHHVLTGYDTSFTGEAQVSAWEARTGFAPYLMVRGIIFVVMGLGYFVNPVAVWRACNRGRGGRNLFAEGFREELLDMEVGEVRRRLGIV
jgi:hypothetical protein